MCAQYTTRNRIHNVQYRITRTNDGIEKSSIWCFPAYRERQRRLRLIVPTIYGREKVDNSKKKKSILSYFIVFFSNSDDIVNYVLTYIVYL